MRTVDGRLALRENDAILVWAEHVARAQNRLPTGGHPARRGKDIVPAVALVKLRSFNRGMMLVAVEHERPFIQHVQAIGTEAVDVQHALDPRSAVGERANEISLAVARPQKAGADPTPGFLPKYR